MSGKIEDRDRRARDTFGRPLRDLRISVIDNCNLRCTYCMPKEQYGERYRFLSRDELLSFEEIERLARVFAQAGVTKLRLTGGEPLLRARLDELVARLASVPGIEDLALTTNGLLLPRTAEPLRSAGLDRLTVSLDSLDPEIAGELNGRGVPPSQVLEGIAAAQEAGFDTIKINTVVQRGVNDTSYLELAEHFRGSGCVLRFIEYMDVGTMNSWNAADVVPSAEIRARIAARYPLHPVDPEYTGEVARRYAYDDGMGEIGFITSVTEPFCGDCSRARLSADGQLYTCLFAGSGHDLRSYVRSGRPDEELFEHISGIWSARTDRYSELRELVSETAEPGRRVEMYHIGG